MSIWNKISLVLLVILAGMALYELYVFIMTKRSAKVLDQEEFKAGMRKAQVVDVREKNEFDAGHILGARNMPYSAFKLNLNGLRKDKPVYLYDQKKALSARTANLLRKNGFQDIYILKGGYQDWTGKTKKKTY